MSDKLSILMVNNSVSPLITMLIPSFLLEFAGRIISVFKKYTHAKKGVVHGSKTR